jgi:hypothetical protein
MIDLKHSFKIQGSGPMKKRSLNKYAFICVVLATLLLASSPVWAADSTELYYRIYDDSTPQLILDDTETGKTDWYLIIDWPLTEVFSIYNSENNSNPFIIENGTADNLLYLDAAERIGINTNVPAEELDIRSVNPAIRLYDTSSGAGRVDLDMNSNEFAIQGETNQEIVEIDTRAPYASFTVDSSGEVGIGTNAPSKKLHVSGSDSATLDGSNILARIENTTGTTGSRHMLQLVNRGNPLLWFHNTQNDYRWSMNPIDTSFVFSRGGTGGYEMQLYSTGNLVIRGTLTQNSDRNTKKNIETVNPAEVLEKAAELPISSWQFKNDTEKSRHLGPMAQDFYAAFGLGRDEKGIAPGDMSGVALAAIQGLYTVVKDKNYEIAQLKEQLKIQQQQIAKLSALEHVVATLVEQLNAQGPMNVSFETTPPAGNHSF